MMHGDEMGPQPDASADGMDPAAQPQKIIPREEPTVAEQRAALVEHWTKTVKKAKTHWEKDFQRMRKNMEFAKLGADGDWVASNNYTVNILQRHINQKVASLYAKNPRAIVERAERLDFQVWDGKAESLQAAQMTMTVNPFDPTVQALIQDVFQGMQRRAMFDKIGRTMVILLHYFMREGNQRFKRQCKQGVRRALVTGIAYCELGFQRLMEPRPEAVAQINDATNRLKHLETLMADMADGVLKPDDAEIEKARLMLRDLQEQQNMIVREGPVFDWPRSTEIIIDPDTSQIEGWVGTNWLAREFKLSPQQIKEKFQIDVSRGVMDRGGEGSTAGKMPVSTEDGNTANSGRSMIPASGKRYVWKVWDKTSGQEFWVMDGYPDFLSEPQAPDVQVESFFPIHPLQFNPIEDDQTEQDDGPVKRTRVFGLSEIELLCDMQNEYNRSRQSLREHRHANRPGYVVVKGLLEPNDKAALETHPANAIVELKALHPQQKIGDVIQPFPKIGIDPGLYDVSPIFDDFMRSGGAQEANLGGTKGDSATEASIAEGSRVTATQSNVDDLDDFLSDIARGAGQIMLLNMTHEQVTKIAGPGAVWPEFTAQEVAEEVFLAVKAGSSGRPNKQLEIANFERLAPLLLQIPGIQPRWLADKAIERMDDDMDIAEAFLDGLPSIIALNSAGKAQAAAQGDPRDRSTGTPDAPAAQGGQGAQNAPDPQANEPGPQPGFPAPGAF